MPRGARERLPAPRGHRRLERAAAGLDVAVEDASSAGRLDMAVRFGGHVYLFEFKTTAVGSAGSAVAQIRERRYADKYRRPGQPIHLIGVAFDPRSRNIDAFEVESAQESAP